MADCSVCPVLPRSVGHCLIFVLKLTLIVVITFLICWQVVQEACGIWIISPAANGWTVWLLAGWYLTRLELQVCIRCWSPKTSVTRMVLLMTGSITISTGQTLVMIVLRCSASAMPSQLTWKKEWCGGEHWLILVLRSREQLLSILVPSTGTALNGFHSY